MKNLLLSLVTIFLFSCASELVDNLGKDKGEIVKVASDRLMGIGKIESQREFILIGKKYIYLVKDNELNQLLAQTPSSRHYRILDDKLLLMLDNNSNNKAHTSFWLIDNQSGNKIPKLYSVDLELFKTSDEIKINEATSLDIPIEIRQHKVKKGNKFLSAVLKPFAFVTDVIFSLPILFLMGPGE